MPVIRAERPVSTSPEVAWDVVGRPAAIDEYADNISRAETDGEGEGMHRRCWDNAGNGWDETCRVWEAGERYAFEVHTETSGSRIHRWFTTFVGSFGVDERDGETVIWASFELEPRFGIVGRALLAVMTPVFRRGVGGLLDSWAEDVEARAAPEASVAA